MDLATIKTTIGNYIRKEPLAVIATLISGLTLYHQTNIDNIQSDFIRSQQESLSISLGRNHFNTHDELSYINNPRSESVETNWSLEINNTSTQAPITISRWTIYRKWNKEFDWMTGSDTSFDGYTPFYALSGEPVNLPFTIAAGNTLKLKLKIRLGVTSEASEELYRFQTDHLSLSEAEGLYSWNTSRKGIPKDIFGDEGFDNNGFHLAIPNDEANKLVFPVLRLDLESSRGKTYSGFSSWFYMMVFVPRKDWNQENQEVVKHPDPLLWWQEKPR